MHPYFHLGSTDFPAYATIILFGLILGIIYIIICSRSRKLNILYVILSCIFALIGLIFGAKILFAITTIPEIIQHWDYAKKYTLDTLVYMFSGFVFYGGLLGVLGCLKLFSIQFDQPFNKYMGLYIPIFPLVHAIGRIGCFFAGCCFGIESHDFLSVTYPKDAIVENVNLVPRFPVQLFEAFLNLILFIFLIIYIRKPRRDRKVLGIYLIGYGVIRFVTEFLRGDTIRGSLLGLSTSQWISLILIPIGIWLIYKKSREPNV